MAEKRIDSDFLEEETLNLESTGRYRITSYRRARGEPGDAGRNQPAIHTVFVDRGILRR